MNFIEKARKTSMRAGREIVARLLIDSDKGKILFVPSNINHPEYLAGLLGITKEKLKENPEIVSPYVGAAVKLNEMETAVDEILVGISGLETVFSTVKSPLHTKKQVNVARDILVSLLQKENILSVGFKLKTMYK
tara:strand:- start:660 stop:1064 length:405 start_codon:yes stop_codon:yes gene_type:complete